MQDMVRQGDVLLRPLHNVRQACVSAVTAGLVARVPAENGRVVLAHGEVTGHHHSFALSDRVAMFRDDGAGSGSGFTLLEVKPGEPLALEHQEHTALLVQPGVHEVVRQRVFLAGMAARVVD